MKYTDKLYVPDHVSPPGDTLDEVLATVGMTQAELALRIGRPKKTVNEIVKGKTSLTPETALQLELALGISASFWNERERKYREWLARVEQSALLGEWKHWLQTIPYQELVAKQWLSDCPTLEENVQEALAFFGVASPEQWRALWASRMNVTFRKSASLSANDIANIAWLRRVELVAALTPCEPFEATSFSEALDSIKALTTKQPVAQLYTEQLRDICAKVGVALAIVPRLGNSNIYGASFWLSPSKAVIALSLYYKTDDQFWFTFFHEAAHLLLHSKKEFHIDQDTEAMQHQQMEQEANTFAANQLIPDTKLKKFVSSRPRHPQTGEPYFDEKELCFFALQIGIAPSILVGRLQHDQVMQKKFKNEFKSKLDWGTDWQLIVTKLGKTCYF